MDAATCREWENRVSSREKGVKLITGKRAKRCAKCGYFSSISQRNKHINNDQKMWWWVLSGIKVAEEALVSTWGWLIVSNGSSIVQRLCH